MKLEDYKELFADPILLAMASFWTSNIIFYLITMTDTLTNMLIKSENMTQTKHLQGNPIHPIKEEVASD